AWIRRSRRIRHCVGCDAAASYPTYRYHRARRLDKAFTPHPAKSRPRNDIILPEHVLPANHHHD
ncbi:hypothetical protein, partial [Escherichia sp. E4930]|uniref:hypothetical protein n=1 Tax=Escherichia sp. E4930 TaxID=2044468 RepID=UPI00197A8D2B